MTGKQIFGNIKEAIYPYVWLTSFLFDLSNHESFPLEQDGFFLIIMMPLLENV